MRLMNVAIIRNTKVKKKNVFGSIPQGVEDVHFNLNDVRNSIIILSSEKNTIQLTPAPSKTVSLQIQSFTMLSLPFHSLSPPGTLCPLFLYPSQSNFQSSFRLQFKYHYFEGTIVLQTPLQTGQFNSSFDRLSKHFVLTPPLQHQKHNKHKVIWL